MPVLLVAATQRTKDLVFAQNLASQYQLVLEQAQNAQSLRNLLVESRNTLVLWDVDHPGAQDIRDPMSSSTVARELKGLAPADRVIALSDKPLTEMPYLPPVPPFNHHLFRSKAESALQLYMRVSMASMIPDPFGAAQYAPEGTAVQRITLKRASQRKAAVEAVQNVYQKRGGHARLAAMLAQSCDELLLNALFAAPVNAKGERYRSSLPRDSDFELDAREQLTLELASGPDYLVLSVADQFGSLDKQRILSFMQSDYQKKSLKTSGVTASAALGLYGIFQSGQSLLFAWKPGKRTEIILVFPVAKSLKALKESFRFFSFVEK